MGPQEWSPEEWGAHAWGEHQWGPHDWGATEWGPHDIHDHPVMADLDPHLHQADHHSEAYQHEDEHYGMDFNRRHSEPLPHSVESQFFDDG